MIRSLWLALALLSACPALANFSVQTATPAIQIESADERTLAINSRLTLALNPATEEALHNGVPLEIVIDLELLRHRWWWTNRLITDITLRRRLSFHALSRQYLVSSLVVKQRAESFGSLDLALAHAGNLSRLEFALPSNKQILPGARHLLRLRARLDIEALPTVMRPLAYASPSWRLGTGWTTWPVQH
jgi:Domain of unknown function (DUF4390)